MRKILMSALLAFFMAGAMAAEAPVDPVLQTFGKTVEKIVKEGDAPGLAAVIDMDEFGRRMRNSDSPDDLRQYQAFLGGMKKSVGPSLMKGLQNGELQFLRVRTVDKDVRAVFRNSMGEELNYVEMVLVKKPDGAVHITDFYMWAMGEYFSETIRVMYQNMLQKDNPAIFKKVFGNGPNPLESLPKMQEMTKHLNEGRAKEAMDIYNALPKEMKAWKPAKIGRIRAATGLTELHLMEALNDYERVYPKDPALNLLKIIGFRLQLKFDEALKGVDVLETAVGGDPYLDMLRGIIHIEAGRKEQGIVLAQKVAVANPDSMSATLGLLTCQMMAKDFANAVKTVTKFEAAFGWDDTPVQENPVFMEFLASPEYKAWMAKRK